MTRVFHVNCGCVCVRLCDFILGTCPFECVGIHTVFMCILCVSVRVWLLLVCAGLYEINRTCSKEWDDGQWTQLRRQLWGGGGGEVERGREGRGRSEREGWEESNTVWRAKCPDSHRSRRVGPLQAWQMDRQGYALLADSGSWCQRGCTVTSTSTHKTHTSTYVSMKKWPHSDAQKTSQYNMADKHRDTSSHSQDKDKSLLFQGINWSPPKSIMAYLLTSNNTCALKMN